jgi:hypothetical protein
MVCAGVPTQPGVGLSAKTKQYSHRFLTRGMYNCNYHKIMNAVLEGILAAQKKGGFKAFFRWAMLFA